MPIVKKVYLIQKVDSEGSVVNGVLVVVLFVVVVAIVVEVVVEEKKAKKPFSSIDSSEMNRTDIRLPVLLVKVIGNSLDKFPLSLARGGMLRSHPSQI